MQSPMVDATDNTGGAHENRAGLHALKEGAHCCTCGRGCITCCCMIPHRLILVLLFVFVLVLTLSEVDTSLIITTSRRGNRAPVNYKSMIGSSDEVRTQTHNQTQAGRQPGRQTGKQADPEWSSKPATASGPARQGEELAVSCIDCSTTLTMDARGCALASSALFPFCLFVVQEDDE